MIQEILREVIANVECFEIKLRKWAIKLMSITIFGWMIVGSTAVGLMLPAYIVAQVMRLG